MKQYFENQLKENNIITKHNVKKLAGKSIYSNYQIGDKILYFLELSQQGEDLNYYVKTIVERELDIFENDYKFIEFGDRFPIFIKKDKK